MTVLVQKRLLFTSTERRNNLSTLFKYHYFKMAEGIIEQGHLHIREIKSFAKLASPPHVLRILSTTPLPGLES
jgi:hypothetical protein